MKKLIVLAMVVFLAIGLEAQAVTIDFTAEAYRGAGGYGTGALATMTENEVQDGFYAETKLPGQKVSYGTEYFNGGKLSDIDYLQFTFRNGHAKSPYSKLAITNGSGAYGVISSQGGYLSDVEDHSSDTSNPYYQATRTFYFAGKNGNSVNNYNFRFWEPAGSAAWTHGAYVTWEDIDDWYLLGIGEERPLSGGPYGELTYKARSPLYTGLNIIWGDSMANYIGYRGVWDVNVQGIDGTNYKAGPVPEPATLLLLCTGLVGLIGARRKMKK